MKPRWLILVGATVALGGLFGLRISAQEKVFKAGIEITDISPTNFPVLVNAMFTERVATNVVDTLNARALVLDNGEKRIAMAVVDSCMVPRSLIDQAKAIVKEATGIATDQIMISATH